MSTRLGELGHPSCRPGWDSEVTVLGGSRNQGPHERAGASGNRPIFLRNFSSARVGGFASRAVAMATL